MNIVCENKCFTDCIQYKVRLFFKTYPLDAAKTLKNPPNPDNSSRTNKKKSDMDLICHIMFHLHNQQPPLNINATTNVNAQLQETCAHTVTVDMRDLMLIHPPVPIILRNIA